jgi:hypothetical protein
MAVTGAAVDFPVEVIPLVAVEVTPSARANFQVSVEGAAATAEGLGVTTEGAIPTEVCAFTLEAALAASTTAMGLIHPNARAGIITMVRI